MHVESTSLPFVIQIVKPRKFVLNKIKKPLFFVGALCFEGYFISMLRPGCQFLCSEV